MINKALHRFAGPGLLFVITILFHWKLVLTNQYTWLEAPDLGSLILPWFQFQAGEWHHGRFPMWDPNSWTGQPLFGQAQPGSAYPLNWLLFWMPLKNGWLRQDVLHWFYVLVHYLAGLTCYALCRDLGRSRLASILGGIVYSLAGYVAYTDWPQMLHGAIWAPLVFLFLFRAERGERPLANTLLSGFFLGVTWLAGHHQMQIFLSLAVAGTWLWIGATRQRKTVLLMVAAFGMTGLTSAFQTLPAAEYGRQAVRWVGADEPQGLNGTVPYKVHEQYALKPISLIGIFVAGVEHGPYDAYVGVASLTFAVLGAILAWNQRQVRWLATLALCGIVFALGGNSVFHGMFYALAPLVEKARVPEAATLIFAVGLAPLAAFGLDALRGANRITRRDTEPRPAGAVMLTGWILAGFGAIVAFAALFFYAARVQFDERLIVTALCSLLAAGLLTAWGSFSGRAASAAAIGLVLFELGNVTDYNLATADRKTHPYLYQLADHFDMARYVRAQGEPARVYYDGKAIPYNIGDWYGLEAFNAYAASVPSALWQFDLSNKRVLDILGIRYYFGVTPPWPGLREVFEGRSGQKIFENPKAFPRVWAVHATQAVADARATLSDPKFDARHVVFEIGQQPPALASCDGDDVWMPHHEPNRVTIHATLPCRGMVILTDTWFPGWIASVDGRAAKIEKAYGAFRGIVVEAGDHTIEMKYRPWSVFLGAALTALAAIIALVSGLGKKARHDSTTEPRQ